MVAVTADLVPSRSLFDPAKPWRALAFLLLLGYVSFASVAGQPLPPKGHEPPDQGRPFTLGLSALGGPDCLGGRTLSAPARPEE